jgi:hypothetical protein
VDQEFDPHDVHHLRTRDEREREGEGGGGVRVREEREGNLYTGESERVD